MLIVGLTGGIGSGKSTISRFFEGLGVDIVDTDVIAREVVMPGTPCLSEIREHFGEEILLGNDELDRRKLREIIFSTPEEKVWLEKLLHPAIRTLTREKLARATSPYAILSSPLLLESPDRKLVTRVAVVDVPIEKQLKRTTERDKTQSSDVKKIIESQMPREQRLALADDIIDNSGAIEDSKNQVLKLHEMYLALSNK